MPAFGAGFRIGFQVMSTNQLRTSTFPPVVLNFMITRMLTEVQVYNPQLTGEVQISSREAYVTRDVCSKRHKSR